MTKLLWLMLCWEAATRQGRYYNVSCFHPMLKDNNATDWPDNIWHLFAVNDKQMIIPRNY